MSPQEIGFIGIAVLLVLLMLGCPVGIAMILVGFSGFAAIIGLGPALNVLQTGAFETAANYSFTLVPLFLLMGSLVSRAGLSRDLFLAARRFTQGWNGGLAVAGVAACAAFSAVSGSSLATASTMTRVAYPEMRAQGYDPRLAALYRGLRWPGLIAALKETVQVSATIFIILIGAEVFGFLLSVSQISFAMADMIRDAGWAPWQLMLAIMVFYLVLGCFMESLAMILLTVPIFFPLVVDAGFDPIWFGVITVVIVETGLISPPVGMNLFVVRGAVSDLELKDVMIGVLPFVVTDIIRLAILIAFPAIALALPRLFG